MTTNIIEFVADEDIVNTIIRGQHTDLSKALLELVMNSVDSKAQNCSVMLTREGFKVQDDGAGFGTYDDILVSFKRIGRAHKDAERTYGRFGMGRGQIMPWGRVCWSSGVHRMTTDLNAFNGFEYVEGEDWPGCTVEGGFYEALPRYEFFRAQDELVRRCRLIDSSIKIVINNHHVNSADDMIWDEETEDYRIRWHQSNRDHRSINIYNQGVYICEFPDYTEGLGADVVAKKAMTLNMARNSIDPKDPLWQRISARIVEKIREHRLAQSKRKAMTEDMRQPLIDALAHPSSDVAELIFEQWRRNFGNTHKRVCHLPLLRDSRGRYQRFDTLDNRPLTFVPAGREKEAESVAIQKLAVPVTLYELRLWGVETASELIEKYNSTITKRLWQLSNPEQPSFMHHHLNIDATVVSFDVIAAGLNTDNVHLKQKELRPKEAAARNALEYASGIMAKRLSNIDRANVRKRRIVLGESVSSDGWTDSVSFIAINRKMVQILDRGQAGATQLALLLLHEYVHDKDHPDSNEHGELFYERFHNLASHYSGDELVGNVARSIWHRYLTELNKKGLGLPKAAEGHSEASRTFVYTITLANPKLSVMAKALMEKIGLDYRLRGRTLTLKSNVDYFYARGGVLAKWLSEHIPAQLGLDTLGSYRQRFSTFETRDDPDVVKIMADHRTAIAEAWAADTGGLSGSYLAALDMISTAPLLSEDKLLQFLIADPGTDVRQYQSEPTVPMPVRTLGGPGYQFQLTMWEWRGLGQYENVVKIDAESVKSNRGARIALVMSRVTEAVTSIADPDERAALIDTLQSESFMSELRTAKRRP